VQDKLKKRSGLFSTPYASLHKSIQIKAISKQCKRMGKLRCLNRHISKGDLVDCITDLCNGLKARNARKFEKHLKHDKKRWEKVFKKRR